MNSKWGVLGAIKVQGTWETVSPQEIPFNLSLTFLAVIGKFYHLEGTGVTE